MLSTCACSTELCVGLRTMSKSPMVVSNRTTWAVAPPAKHKQIAIAMPDLNAIASTCRSSAERRKRRSNLYPSRPLQIRQSFAPCRPEVLRGVWLDSSDYLGMTVKCLAESDGYPDTPASSSFKNVRNHAGCAGHAAAVTKLPSTQALSSPAAGSSQTAPA